MVLIFLLVIVLMYICDIILYGCLIYFLMWIFISLFSKGFSLLKRLWLYFENWVRYEVKMLRIIVWICLFCMWFWRFVIVLVWICFDFVFEDFIELFLGIVVKRFYFFNLFILKEGLFGYVCVFFCFYNWLMFGKVCLSICEVILLMF